MRIAATATAVTGALAVALVGISCPAEAATATMQVAQARVNWVNGAHVDAATEGVYWRTAAHHLAAYGTGYSHEQDDLSTLADTPETDTTAAQRVTAARVVRELNAFFLTPDLYGVPQGNPSAYAKADWITSTRVAAVTRKNWLRAAADELAAYRTRYATQRSELRSLASLPLTDITAAQRADAHRWATNLDSFFMTPGLNN